MVTALLALICVCGPGSVGSEHAEIGQLLIVVADSVPLYDASVKDARVVKYAHATLQLEVVDVSEDSLCYQVKIGEQKGYQLNHGGRYWVRVTDVVSPTPKRSSVSVDLSVLEVPDDDFTRRVTTRSFVNSRGELPPPFFVSVVYRNPSPTSSCSPPFSVCAQIYRPGQYFLGVDDPEEAHSVYDRLYHNGTLRPFYEINASQTITKLRERVVLARVIMQDAGCYAEEYLRTEVMTLVDTLRTVGAATTSHHNAIDTAQLFATAAEGEVQYVNIMYVLELHYEDSVSELVVRRFSVGWPLCM